MTTKNTTIANLIIIIIITTTTTTIINIVNIIINIIIITMCINISTVNPRLVVNFRHSFNRYCLSIRLVKDLGSIVKN
jgi:hypothetical protein